MEEKKKKAWVITEDEKEDKIKNRPEWTHEKPREEITFEPKPPNPLEDWLTNK